MIHNETIAVATRGRGTYEVTAEVERVVSSSGVDRGVCHVFVHHTSASLLIGENADPSVRRDLDRFLARLVPDGDPLFEHDSEGPDDMPAHIRAAITATSLTIPVARGACDLGTLPGVFLWEHRTAPHRRRFTVSVVGE